MSDTPETATETPSQPVICLFCDRPNTEPPIKKMIVRDSESHKHIAICNECVSICVDILVSCRVNLFLRA